LRRVVAAGGDAWPDRERKNTLRKKTPQPVAVLSGVASRTEPFRKHETSSIASPLIASRNSPCVGRLARKVGIIGAGRANAMMTPTTSAVATGGRQLVEIRGRLGAGF
jgi:hypothetical protein